MKGSTLAASKGAAIVGLLLCFWTLPATAQHKHSIAYESLRGQLVVANEAIIKLSANARAEALGEIASAHDIDATEGIGDGSVFLLHSRTLNTLSLIRKLAKRTEIAYAEPNMLLYADVIPNDPHFNSQWSLLNTVVPGADISATSAWDVTTGSRTNVVGVIDSGVDYNHPDLAANFWSAPVPFNVSIGGVTMTCPAGSHGFNAVSNTFDPMDDNNHGTHVSGIIGAVGNDGYGICGVNWTVGIMGIKFLDAAGMGTAANAINAIEFAIQAKLALGDAANVRILSNSWGGLGFSQALLDEIDKAGTNGILCVFASGNKGQDNDVVPYFPASYSRHNMIVVAATSSSDILWGFSNIGPTTVDLAAPGFEIISTIITSKGGYASFSGTSMAAPHVSGVAALMLAVDESLTVDQMKTGILGGVDPLDVLSGITVTGGRLNANTAVHKYPLRATFTIAANPITVTSRRKSSATSTITVGSVNGFNSGVDLSLLGLPHKATYSIDPATIDPAGSSTLTINIPANCPPGSYVLTIQGESGSIVHTAPALLTILKK